MKNFVDQNRVSRHLRFLFAFFCIAAFCIAALSMSSASAQSALELVSGFDTAGVEKTYPIVDTNNVSELSKLLYRMGNLKRSMLEKRLGENAVIGDASADLGDAVRVAGKVTKVQAYAVPGELPELLDFEKIAKITIELDEADPASSDAESPLRTAIILTAVLQQRLAIGDRVETVGVRLAGDSEFVCAAGEISWFPAKPTSTGWQLLAGEGYDLSQLATLRKLSRRSFTAEDATPFYGMVRAADAVSQKQPQGKSPEAISPAELLGDPTDRIGDWVAIEAETVRVTRVSVTDPARQKQLGGDHYFQIDSIGKLGNVRVQVSRFEGDPEPIEFQNRYPLSVVMKTLPDFLKQRFSGDAKSVVALVNHPVRVEGFYYRLWSYKSDLMEREGAGDQFGPLVIATKLRNKRVAASSDQAGVSMIGYVAAGFLLLGMIAIIAWSVHTSKQDKQARAKRPGPSELNLD